jgi:serine/threonine protein kinase
MREAPSKSLVQLLEKLGLAGEGPWKAARRRVRRLARDLPVFESVWIDALAQARLLTPFQASELNAGRGEALRIGPYVLCRRLPSPGYVKGYLARHAETGQVVCLAAGEAGDAPAEDVRLGLQRLAAAGQSLASEHLAPVTAAGADAGRYWAVSRHLPGLTAAEWMVRSGRFSPNMVSEIARQMLAGLMALQKARMCHGGISAGTLVLMTASGQAVLLQPGLRAVFRPAEGYGRANLPPEDYDGIPPERLTRSTPPDMAGDVYACGCLWWHLLAGRPAVPGGDALTKLRNLQTTAPADIRALAPDTPAPLAAAVAACTRRDPAERPPSLAALVEMLGPPDRDARKALRRTASGPPGRSRFLDAIRQIPLSPWRLAACGALLAAIAVAWSLWGGRSPVAAESIAAAPSRPPEEATQPHSTTQKSVPSPRQARPRPTGAGTTRTKTPGGVPNLVLAADRAVQLDPLSLRPGQLVCGTPGSRPLVVVPPGGLMVKPEGVRFENIDFLAAGSDSDPAAKAAPADENSTPAIVRLGAWRAEFRGCSFQAAQNGLSPPAAVYWSPAVKTGPAELSLPSGQVLLADCVLRNVQAGVVCPPLGAVSVELDNTLCLAPGPLVRLDRCPRADEPIALRLSHVTLRSAGPLLECRYPHVEESPGAISIQADNSVLMPATRHAIVSFVGPGSPERLLVHLRWTGQGSLVAPDAAVAQWEPPGGKAQPLDDASAAIAGLVRGDVEFAGRLEEGPQSHRVVRWQAPLSSAEAPGVEPGRLAWPAAPATLAAGGAESFDKPRP